MFEESERIYRLTPLDKKEIYIRAMRFAKYESSHFNGKSTYFVSKQMVKDLDRISYLTGFFSKRRLFNIFDDIGGFSNNKDHSDQFVEALINTGIPISKDIKLSRVEQDFINSDENLPAYIELHNYQLKMLCTKGVDF